MAEGDPTGGRVVTLLRTGLVVAWNAVPVAAVVSGNWSVATVLVLYWIEAAVLALTGGIRVALAVPETVPDSAVRRLRAYEQGVDGLRGVVALSMPGWWVVWPIAGYWLVEVGADVGTALQVPGVAWAVVGVFVGYATDLGYGYVYRRGYAATTPDREVKRLLVHNFAIVGPLFGFTALARLDHSLATLPLVAVVLFKTAVELGESILLGRSSVDRTPTASGRPDTQDDADEDDEDDAGTDDVDGTHGDDLDGDSRGDAGEDSGKDPVAGGARFVRRPDRRRLQYGLLSYVRRPVRPATLLFASVAAVYVLGRVESGDRRLDVAFLAGAALQTALLLGLLSAVEYAAHRDHEYRLYDDRILAVDRRDGTALWSLPYEDVWFVSQAPPLEAVAREGQSGIELYEHEGSSSPTWQLHGVADPDLADWIEERS